MNKKGLGGTLIIIILIIIALFVIFLLFKSPNTFQETPETRAEEKCAMIGLDLLDYSYGGVFTESSITCVNNETKEITKIR